MTIEERVQKIEDRIKTDTDMAKSYWKTKQSIIIWIIGALGVGAIIGFMLATK